MFIFKNKEYETLLEAVDASYCDNDIHTYEDVVSILNARIDRANEIIKEISKEDYYDFEVNKIKSKDDLLKEFNITEF